MDSEKSNEEFDLAHQSGVVYFGLLATRDEASLRQCIRAEVSRGDLNRENMQKKKQRRSRIS